MNRALVVDQNFVNFCREVASHPPAVQKRALDEPIGADPSLTGQVLYELFESQMLCRLMDIIARDLRKQNRGFYTIGSAGHEGNAVLGRLVRYSDPAFLYYRDAALMAERSRQLPGQDWILDTLLSFMASSLDPSTGGRHKVFGSAALCVPPQTSTIASQLPKSVGAALALERCKRFGIPPVFGAFGETPADSIMLCSFGDAATNHATAQSAFNLAAYASYQRLPVPILFVCQDNGIGISVHTAPGWVQANFEHRNGLKYFSGTSLDLVDAWRATSEAVEYVRSERKPAFLHLSCVRLLGHAGTDPETEYHTMQQIEAAEARDPLLATARLMIDNGFMTAEEVLALYEDVRQRITSQADAIGEAPKLSTAEEVMASLAPYTPDEVAAEATRVPDEAARLFAFELENTPGFPKASEQKRLPELQAPRHLSMLLNWALRDLMAKYPEMMIFGEDVAARGGVYYVTAGLAGRFGLGHVFNTLLDETSILGMAIGAGHYGLLPFPEIQYLAYLHNALDQLRSEACSAQFFSQGQFPNPMVVRIQSWGYQKGFGGHFHNDNSIAALRDIPSLIVATPARGDDAARMLRTCAALSRVNGRVVAFLEPIALYNTKDLYEPGDGQWLCQYPPPNETIALGEAGIYDADATDLTILTFANGLYMSLRAARMLQQEHGVRARIVDLRWLSPLNEDVIVEQALATGRVLVVDEGRYTGGVSEAILAVLMEKCRDRVVANRLTGKDTYTPLGPSANTVLPTEPDIVEAALTVLREPAPT